MTELGETCSDINLASITDEYECKKVAENHGMRYFGKEHAPRIYVPSGCYFLEAGDEGYFYDAAFWNQNESDTGNEDLRAICKEGIFNHS